MKKEAKKVLISDVITLVVSVLLLVIGFLLLAEIMVEDQETLGFFMMILGAIATPIAILTMIIRVSKVKYLYYRLRAQYSDEEIYDKLASLGLNSTDLTVSSDRVSIMIDYTYPKGVFKFEVTGNGVDLEHEYDKKYLKSLNKKEKNNLEEFAFNVNHKKIDVEEFIDALEKFLIEKAV